VGDLVQPVGDPTPSSRTAPGSSPWPAASGALSIRHGCLVHAVPAT
jgi:hypothetical protein